LKTTGVIIIALAMLVAITGVVMADPGVAAVPEHQGISTTTIIDVDGLVMDSASMAMTITNNPTVSHTLASAVGFDTGIAPGTVAFDQIVTQLNALGGSMTWHISPTTGNIVVDSMSVPDAAMNVQPVNAPAGTTFGTWYAQGLATPGFMASDVTQGIHSGQVSAGQTQYSSTYDSNLVAQNGHTVMVKTVNIDTGNKLAGQSNVDAKTDLTFIATANGGNAHGSESIMVDGSGSATSTASSMLCPFGPSIVGDVIPPFCNIFKAGGEFDLTVGSVSTAANTKFIGTDSTNPVTLNYQINVKPYGTTEGQIPAMGSASAYYKAHIQEGKTASNTVSEDMTSEETTSVSGVISGFTKIINYQSGPKLV